MKEGNNVFGNSYNHEATIRFFRRWWKLLTVVFVLGVIASGIIAWCITPLYKSTTVIIPSNSNRLSKAIMDYHYSMDFMDYGSERDCEYAIQILGSKRMQMAVCKHFNLMEHYEIAADNPHRMFVLETKYNSRVSMKRTEYMGVEISVLDQDPQMAADMANYIATMYDTLCREIHHDRAVSAAEVMEGVCLSLEREIDSLSKNKDEGGRWKELLITDKCGKLANLQTRAIETKVDKGTSVSYKYVVDPATVADKKASPKRMLIVLGGSLGAVVTVIFFLLVFARKEEE